MDKDTILVCGILMSLSSCPGPGRSRWNNWNNYEATSS